MPSKNQTLNKFAKESSNLLSISELEAIADRLDSVLGKDPEIRTQLCYFHTQVALAILEKHYPGRFERVVVSLNQIVHAQFRIELDARIDIEEYHVSLLDNETDHLLDFQTPYWFARYAYQAGVSLPEAAILQELANSRKFAYQPPDRVVNGLKISVLPSSTLAKVDQIMQTRKPSAIAQQATNAIIALL